MNGRENEALDELLRSTSGWEVIAEYVALRDSGNLPKPDEEGWIQRHLTELRLRRLAEICSLGEDPEFLEELQRAIVFFEEKGVNE